MRSAPWHGPRPSQRSRRPWPRLPRLRSFAYFPCPGYVWLFFNILSVFIAFSLHISPFCTIILDKGLAWGWPPGRLARFQVLAFTGVVMANIAARFFMVPARFNGRIVARLHASSRSIWAWRAPRAGQLPSAPCLFVPLQSQHTAARLAQVAMGLGFQAWVKPGYRCAVYQALPLSQSQPAWVCKVQLPAGVTAAAARARLGAAYRATSAA